MAWGLTEQNRQDFDDWDVESSWGTYTNAGWILSEGQIWPAGFPLQPYSLPYAGWLRDYDDSTNSWLRSPILSNGIGRVEIQALTRQNGGVNYFELQSSSNGQAWVSLGTFTNVYTGTSWVGYTNEINDFAPGYLRILKTGDTANDQRLGLDDVVVYNPAPFSISNLSHAPSEPTIDDGVHVSVEAVIHPLEQSADIKLWYRFGVQGDFTLRTMVSTTGSIYRTETPIPAGWAGTVEYYVEGNYSIFDGGTVFLPESASNAPASYVSTDPYGGDPDPRQLGPSSRRTALTISEIMYHPALRDDGRNLEFIEIYNSEPVDHDISGFRISGGIDYTFPANTVLEARSYAVVAKDPSAISYVYPVSGVQGPYSGDLGNGGDRVRLRNVQDAILLEVEFEDQWPWPIAPDGAGHSLVLREPDHGENTSEAWSSSRRMGGSPGYSMSVQTNALRNVRINEFMAHTDLPQVDFIELYNHGTETVDLSGCVLTDDPTTNRFVIPTGSTLLSGGYAVYHQTNIGFSLSMGGDDIYLVDTNGSSVIDAVRFPAQVRHVTSGRFPDGGEEIRVLDEPTPGLANSALAQRDIVINEIMYHPISDLNDDEFIELHNVGTQAVDIGDWRFIDGIQFTIPTGTVIEAGGYLIVARDALRLMSNYPGLSPVNTIGDFDGSLSDRGEQIVLARPDDPDLPGQDFVTMDSVTYGDGDRWGRWADGGGSSLELIDPRSDNRRDMNWAGSDETMKSTNMWTTVGYTGTVHIGYPHHGTPGSHSPNELSLALLDKGECLVDNVEISKDGGPNLIPNSTFESGLGNWSLRGTHINSSLRTTEGYDGSSQSMHLIAEGDGDNGPNCCETTDFSGLNENDANVAIRATARWLCGHRGLLIHLAGNYLEAAGALDVPLNLGTPGSQNSQYAANAPPSIYDVTHSPILPPASQSAVVTCRVHDPDGLTSVTLKYRVDPSSTLNSLAMNDSGTGADVLANDGIYSADVPGQSANVTVAFRVESTDLHGITSVFPENAPDGECLIMFGQSVPTGVFGAYRIWVTEANRSSWASRRRNSNLLLDCTVVNGESRAIYNGGVRWRGSPFVRPSGNPENNSGQAFVFKVPKDDRLLGVTSFNIDGFENGRDTTYQRERMCYRIADEFLIPTTYQRYVHFYINEYRKASSGNAISGDSHHPSRSYLESWVPDDDEGELFEIDDWFEFNDSSEKTGNLEAQIRDYTTTNGGTVKKKSRYRWNWQKKTNAAYDDSYENIFKLADTMNLSLGSVYEARVAAIVDFEELMRCFATRRIVADWDGWGYNRGKNTYIYKPRKGRWLLFPWDLDFALGAGSNGATTGLFSMTDDVLEFKFFANARFRRAYWRAMQDAVNGILHPDNCEPIMQAQYDAFQDNGVTGAQNPLAGGGMRDWIVSRRNYLISQLNPVTNLAFEITTTDFTTGASPVTIEGLAPVQVETIRVDGDEYPVTWTSETEWQVTLSPVPGSNPLLFSGFDLRGELVATDSINVTYTGAAQNPAGKLVINEIMYNGFDSYGDFVEIHNLSATETFDLGGMRLNGLDFTFMSGTFIGPSDYLVVSESVPGYAATYTNAEVLAGEYPGSLDNGGETISLLMPVSSNEWTVLDQVTYDDVAPWPVPADGTGPSLQLRDATRDNSRVGNWGVDTTVLYTPGEANSLSTNLPAFPQVWLNEVMPSNVSFVADNTGDFDPWVEIYNADTQSVDLGAGDYYLTDDYSNLTQWAFSGGNTVDADSYALVWADGEPAETTGTHWHASFELNSASGSVALVRMQDGSPMVVDYLDYSGIPANNSYGSYPDADSSGRQLFHFPTPGTANNSTSFVATLYINEWMADNETTLMDPTDNNFDDWFEIYNGGTQAVNLAGFTLTDDPGDTNKFTVPLGFQVGAKDFLLVWADNDSEFNGTGSDLHVEFGLNNGGEAIGLYAPDGSPVDSVTFGPQLDDVGEGRWRDGQGAIYQMSIATPGKSNVLFQVLGMEAEGNDSFDLSWQTASGQTYAVWYRADLMTTDPWTLYTNGLVSTGSTMSVSVSLGTNSVLYFKVGREGL
jgi:hypothetical protein